MSAPQRRGGPRGSETQDDLLVRLFADHYKDLVRLASLLLDDVGSCEEVVQDAFVKMHTLTTRPEEGKEAAYLRSMVMNGARSRMRRRMVRRRVVPEAAPPAESAEAGALEQLQSDALIDAVRSLPRRQSEVLTLRYYLDLSEAEIAETLGISPGSVKTHASRGLATLERKLTPPEEDTAEEPS
ncbi:MAG: SigE family RNA polymerase sigma factor [bacterium]|nr:SigE family RNA polymerase sigma factor [bacterium]MCY4104621.1 SigE family RNA polymerase sigma factor [bacterium]